MKISLPDLQSGVTYALQLRATSGDGVSEWSPRFVINVASDTTAPDSPEWAATNPWVVDGETFVATWEPINTTLEQNSDFSHYRLTFSDGIKTVTVKSQNTVYVLTYEQNRNFFGTAKPTITANVSSVDKIGNTSTPTSTLSATNPAPAAVPTVTLTPLIDSIQVDWDASTEDDVVKYVVQYTTGTIGGTYTTVYQGVNNSFTFGTTQWGDDHYIRVAVVDKFGSVSGYTTAGPARPNSSISGDTTPPDNATSFDADATALNTSGGKYEANVTLGWTVSASSDVSHYEIRYGYDTTNWRYAQAPADNNAIRIDGLQIGTPVYFGIRAVDRSSNKSGWANAATYPYTTATDNSAPTTPAAPTVATDNLQLRVEVPTPPANIARYKAYAGTSSGFVVNDASLIGSFEAGTIGVFYYPTDSADDVYVKVVAVSRGGVSSNASPASAAVTVPRINDAMIDNLAANKITAGTGIINDLTIKSNLTVGDGTTPGIIQSNEYVTSGGASGYQLTDSGLIVKSGVIEGAALNISASENIVRPEYAGFEWASYDDRLVGTNGLVFTQDSVFGADGLGFISSTWPAASAGPQLFLTDEVTNYAQAFEVGVKYIISIYMRNPGAVATDIAAKIKWNDTTITQVFTASLASSSSTWVRYSGVVTAAQVAGILFIESTTLTAGAGFDIDLIQIEKAYGSTVPSQWRAPSSTVIDGGMIKTGAIRSNAFAVDAAGNDLTTPAWVIDPEGDASLGNVHVRGSLVVGDSSELLDEELTGKSIVKSYGYIGGVTGWAIRGDGYAEFRNMAADSINGAAIVSGSINAEQIAAKTISGDLLSSNVLLSGRITVGKLDLEGTPIGDATIDPIEQLPDTTAMDVNLIDENDLEYDKWKFVKNSMYADNPAIVTYFPLSSDPNTSLDEYPGGFPAIKISTRGTGSGTTSQHPTQYGATKIKVLAGTTYRVRVGVASSGTRESGAANSHTLFMRYKYASAPTNQYDFVNNNGGVGYSYGDDSQVYWWDFTITPEIDDDIILSCYTFPTSNTSWALSPSHNYALNIISPMVTTAGSGLIEPVTSSTPLPTNPATIGGTVGWGHSSILSAPTYVSDIDISTLATSWPYTSRSDKTLDGFRFTLTRADSNGIHIGLVYVRIPAPPTAENWAITCNWVLDAESEPLSSSADAYTHLIYWYDSNGDIVTGENGNAVTNIKFANAPNNMTGMRGFFGSSYDGYLNNLTDEEASRVAYGVLAIKVPMRGGVDYPAGTTRHFKILGLEAYFTPKDNNNYGELDGSYIEIDNSSGITVYDNNRVPSIVLPIGNQRAIYRGDAEVNSLTVNGSLTVNADNMTFGKSADVLLEAGAAAPTAALTISQQYDQWNVNKPKFNAVDSYADTHVFNPANVTSMTWSEQQNCFFVSELHNGALHIWTVSTTGYVSHHTHWGRGAGGIKWSQVALFTTDFYSDSASVIGRWGTTELRIEWWQGPGSRKSLVTTGGNSYFRNTSQIAAAWDKDTNTNDKRLLMFQNNGSSMRVVRYQLVDDGIPGEDQVGTNYTYYDTPSGTGGTGGLAGAAGSPADFGGFRWVAANRTSEQVKVMTAHAGSTVKTNERWDVASAPVAFCWNGTHFWQLDSSGTLTKYSDWKWTTTGDKFHFAATFYDSDAAGGTHETTMGPVFSQAAKKRIGSIVVTGPRVPDGGSSDDPDKMRIYGVKSTMTTVPTRTQLWLQGTGGSSEDTSVFTFPSNTLLSSGTNPPATNNFPSADSAELYSSASDGSGSLINIKGDGTWRLGNLSGAANGTVSDATDVDWTNIPLASGYEAASQGTPQYKRKNGVVYIRGSVQETASGTLTLNSSPGHSIGTMPAGFRPLGADIANIVPPQNPAVNQARMFVWTNGTIKVYLTGSGATDYVSLNASYPV